MVGTCLKDEHEMGCDSGIELRATHTPGRSSVTELCTAPLLLIWRQGLTELSRLAVISFCSSDRDPPASASLEAGTIGLGHEASVSICISCLVFSGLVALGHSGMQPAFIGHLHPVE